MPVNVQETTIISSYDGTPQPVAYFDAGAGQRPLVVALHTWGYGYDQPMREKFFRCASDRGWHCVFPHFRGPNGNPEACASPGAVRDVLDAVEWASDSLGVEQRRIFLTGVSGGGHMALMLAGITPASWTAVSAWASITDLGRWHRETSAHGLTHYTDDIERICDGPPGASVTAEDQYRMRSPLTELWRAHILPVDINHGVRDGHDGSVPVGHSIRAFNELVRAADNPHRAVPDFIIDHIEREAEVPQPYPRRAPADPDYDRTIFLREESGLSRLTIFDGGHEMLYDAAFSFFGRF